MRIEKAEWITAHNCGKPKWHSFTHTLSWKEKFGASTLSHKMCPRKQTTEPKLLILVSYCGKHAVPFFMGHHIVIQCMHMYLILYNVHYALYNAIVHEVITGVDPIFGWGGGGGKSKNNFNLRAKSQYKGVATGSLGGSCPPQILGAPTKKNMDI